MSAASEDGHTVGVVAVWALLVAALGTGAVLFSHSDRSRRPPAALPATTLPATTTPAPIHPSTTVAVTGTPSRQTPTNGAAAGATPSSPATPTGVTTLPVPATSATQGAVSAPSIAVTCHPDLPLEESPDTPYGFLCTRGTVPITWPTDSLRLYTSGLTPAQSTALPIALEQWQSRARFTVTRVSSAAVADVIVTTAVLTNNEDGYSSMHYVCSSSCVYDHADVQLTSTAELTKTSWISTIMHELGHVAGLNHVSRPSEVMYPQIDASSPVTYGTGDAAGFQALERQRPAP